MSITVYRNKNGIREPIKISILDAFRGAPPRQVKSELKSASTSEKPSTGGSGQTKDSKPSESKDSGNDNKAQSTKPLEAFSAEDNAKIIEMKAKNKPWKEICAAIGKESHSQVKQHYKDNLEGKPVAATDASSENKNHSTKLTESFTPKDDATIVEMKAANKPWKEICAAIGKDSQSQVKQHYKDHLEGRSTAATTTENKDIEKKETKAEDSKPNGSSGKNQKKPPTPTDSDAKKPKNPKSSTTNEKLVEAIRSYGEHYDQHKWLAIASRHYDKTGQRISARTAQEIYEGKVRN